MMRAYYFSKISDFITQSDDEILGLINRQYEYIDLKKQQQNAWCDQISLLKERFSSHFADDFTIAFEYIIPRMGKRADCIILSEKIVYVLEFKVGASRFDTLAMQQVEGYAVDLKTFHEASHNLPIVPILICTEASGQDFSLKFDKKDLVANVVKSNGQNLETILSKFEEEVDLSICHKKLDSKSWINASYKPTPTIIEAARALYEGHQVEDISRSDAGSEELPKTRDALWKIIKLSKEKSRKSICFVTGVPGAGKTLVGLDLASSSRQECNKENSEDHAVFLSGNGPLVEVLREALARDEKEKSKKCSLKDARRNVSVLIQNVHHFRDYYLKNSIVPSEHVVIFDEAQRAWNEVETFRFMKKRKVLDFRKSEPEFLIEVMDRHQDWAVIVCLVGGGQEINKGEAGLPGWFEALRKRFQNWDIYISDSLKGKEYIGEKDLFEGGIIQNNLTIQRNLHLSVSNRSFRSEKLSLFIQALLDIHPDAGNLYAEVTAPDPAQIATEKTKYPLYITRDLDAARSWLRVIKKGAERVGIIVSSGARRLKPYAINVKKKSNDECCHWFLAEDDQDIRSSNFLEEVTTEFEVQGLEVDYACVAWGGNFRFNGKDWDYKNFKGKKWQNINDDDMQKYLKNSYRVLLTRARKGMVIFVPKGSDEDATRKPEYYDNTYKYFLSLGMKELPI